MGLQLLHQCNFAKGHSYFLAEVFARISSVLIGMSDKNGC